MIPATKSESQQSPYSRDNIRKGIGYHLLGRGMSGLAGLASVILLARFMDVQSYAGYTALTGLIIIAGMFSDLGLTRAVIRYVPEGSLFQPAAALARFIWSVGMLRLAAAAVLSAMIAFFWPHIVSILSVVKISTFPWALACFLVATTLFQHFSAVLQALVLQSILTRVLVVQWGGRLVFILSLIVLYSGITLDQALWIMAVPEAGGVAIFLIVIRHYLAALPKPVQDSDGDHSMWPPRGEVGRLAMHNFAYNLLATPPQGSFMRLLAAALLPAHFVASYGFFQSLVERAQPYLPLQLLYNIAEPVLIAGYVKDNNFATLSQRSQLLYKANLMLLVPFIVFVAVVAPELTTLMTGGRFAEYAWLLPLLVLQVTVGNHATTLQLVLNAIKQSGLLLKSGFVALLAMASALAIAALTARYEYLVLTPLAFELTNNAGMILLIRRRGYPYLLLWPVIARLLLPAVAAYGAAMLCIIPISTPLWRVVTAASIVLGAFVPVAIFAEVFAVSDKQLLRDVLWRSRS